MKIENGLMIPPGARRFIRTGKDMATNTNSPDVAKPIVNGTKKSTK